MAMAKTERVTPTSAAVVKSLVEKRDEDGEAFEREALGAEVALLDDLLEEVGADEVGEDAGAGRWCGRGGAVALEALLDPCALLGRGDVHELGADGAAVDSGGPLRRRGRRGRAWGRARAGGTGRADRAMAWR